MLAALTLDPVACLTLRAVLALLLLSGAVLKLRDLGAFRAAVAGYALVPPCLLGLVSVVLVGSELVVGGGLLLPASGGRGALAAAVLIAIYTVAIAINVLRGRRGIDCGCAGPAGQMPLGGGLIARNALLMAMALVAALPAGARSLLWLDAVTIAASVTVLGLLYTAADTALANALHRETRTAARHSGHLPAEAIGGSQWSLP